MLRFGADDVRGICIGEITPVQGRLLYGGREQCAPIWGTTCDDVTQKLKQKRLELKDKFKGICYDTGEQWEIETR